MDSSQSIDTSKRIRLCNLLAFLGAALMAIWTIVEARFGDSANLLFELAFVLGFAGVLVLASRGHDRAARVALLLVANACVSAGAVFFSDAGGNLPFFALAALPLLLFGPRDWPIIAGGAALPVLLFALCDSGLGARALGLHPRLAPGWYLLANALSAFIVAFLVPFSFYRSNLRAEAALERAGQERLKRVLDSDLIGVVRGRVSGRIEDANDTFLGLLGYTRKDLESGEIDFGSIAVPAEWVRAVASRSGGDGATCAPSVVYERSCRRRDGTSVPALIGVARLDETDDEVIGFVLDLTAQKHVQTQRALIAESEEALRLRDLFNSIASHELKTPLTGLMLNLRLVRRRLEKPIDRQGEDGSSLSAQVERCESAAQRMADLIDVLLDVAQIHGGRLKLSRRDMNVVEAVRHALHAFDVDRAEGPQSIVLHADGAVTAPIDGVRFEQVVTNLVSNAVKYGDGKPIEVRVGRDPSMNVARLEVIDSGPGIDPAVAAHVFEPFQRAPAARLVPGLGLGLYVVKMIVEGHGGRVDVDARPGQGARFVVDLPCGATHG